MIERDSQQPDTRRAAAKRCAVVFAASALASLLTLLAFPPFDLWPLAFTAPVPLIWAAERVRGRARWASAAAAFGAVPLWAWESQWIFAVSAAGVVLMVLYLSLFTGLFVWSASWVSRRVGVSVWLAGPVLWVAVEMLRGAVIWHGYPWLLAAHPLIAVPDLAAPAAVIGAYGVSLLTVGVGAAAWVLLAKRAPVRWWGGASLMLLAGVWGGLAQLVPEVSERDMRVAVVQTNVPQSVKGVWLPPERVRDLDRMLGLTIRACSAEPRPELVAWPETMFPGAALDSASLAEERAASLVWHTGGDVAWPEFRHILWRGPDGDEEPVAVTGPIERGDRLAVPTTVAADSVLAWQGRLGVPLILGTEGVDGLQISVRSDGSIEEHEDARYNSTYLVQDGRVLPDRYDKMHLTPFGEVMPYISRWKELESLFLRVGVGAAGMQFNLDQGDRPVVHDVRTEDGLVRVATPICFEGIMPRVCRRLAYDAGERRADLFVQITNEGWFGDFDAGREQHLQIVRWRAVELGISIVRAANTGISAAIDPLGRVIARGVEDGDTNVEGVLHAEAPLAGAPTIYGRVGDRAGWGSLGIGLLLVVSGFVRGRRTSREGPRTDNEPGRDGTNAV